MGGPPDPPPGCVLQAAATTLPPGEKIFYFFSLNKISQETLRQDSPHTHPPTPWLGYIECMGEEQRTHPRKSILYSFHHETLLSSYFFHLSI